MTEVAAHIPARSRWSADVHSIRRLSDQGCAMIEDTILLIDRSFSAPAGLTNPGE
jgi:hypothetical protein